RALVALRPLSAMGGAAMGGAAMGGAVTGRVAAHVAAVIAAPVVSPVVVHLPGRAAAAAVALAAAIGLAPAAQAALAARAPGFRVMAAEGRPARAVTVVIPVLPALAGPWARIRTAAIARAIPPAPSH